MRRRDFIALVGGAATVWSFGARAQPADRTRRIGVLMAHPESDPEYQSYLSAFRQELAARGWREDHNIKIDSRWGALDDPDTRERSARELLALKPDLFLTQNTPPTESMLHLTRTIPIIFVVVTDPVGSGFVKSLASPGGNATGFTIMEPSMGGKWLELLKQIAPQVGRVAFLYNPATAPYVDVYLNPFKAAARALGLEGVTAPVHEESEFKSIFAAQARTPNSGLVLILTAFLTSIVRRLLCSLPNIGYPPYTHGVTSQSSAGCCPTELTSVTSFDLRQRTPIAF